MTVGENDPRKRRERRWLRWARARRVADVVEALASFLSEAKSEWCLWGLQAGSWREMAPRHLDETRVASAREAGRLTALVGAGSPETRDGRTFVPLAEADADVAWVLELADPSVADAHADDWPHLAAALVRCAKLEELERLSIVDPVTGLFNARHLSAVLQREVARCKRFGGSLCLLFVDLDRFKEVNDQLGHPAGTALLAEMGRVLGTTIRRTDYGFRYGGDEFALLLVESTKVSAAQAADRIRRAIEVHARSYPDARAYVTASIGVATFPADATSVDALLARADAAMYAAKAAGRNAVYTLDLAPAGQKGRTSGQAAPAKLNLTDMDHPVLLWDVMGTLVTEPFLEAMPRHFEMSLERLLLEKDPSAWIRFERGEIDEDEYCALFFKDRRSVDKDALKESMRAAYHLLPGVEAILDELKEAGVPMFALSNYSRWYEIIEERLELSRWLGWDFVSCHTGHRKPEPEAYAAPLDALGVPAERCVFVDDRVKNVEAARRMGMKVILRGEDVAALRAELVRCGLPLRSDETPPG